MRHPSSLPAVLLTLACLGSCLAGPHQLKRSLDDWDNEMYVNSPWFDAFLWCFGVMPVCHVGAFTFDCLVGNPYAFWIEDAWDGKGTAFVHAPVEVTDERVESLMLYRSGWTRSESR